MSQAAETLLRNAVAQIQAGRRAVAARNAAVRDMIRDGSTPEHVAKIAELSVRRVTELSSGVGRPRGRPRKGNGEVTEKSGG